MHCWLLNLYIHILANYTYFLKRSFKFYLQETKISPYFFPNGTRLKKSKSLKRPETFSPLIDGNITKTTLDEFLIAYRSAVIKYGDVTAGWVVIRSLLQPVR